MTDTLTAEEIAGSRLVPLGHVNLHSLSTCSPLGRACKLYQRAVHETCQLVSSDLSRYHSLLTKIHPRLLQSQTRSCLFLARSRERRDRDEIKDDNPGGRLMTPQRVAARG